MVIKTRSTCEMAQKEVACNLCHHSEANDLLNSIIRHTCESRDTDLHGRLEPPQKPLQQFRSLEFISHASALLGMKILS